MKELREILAAWEAADRAGQRAALATVVAVEGSAYRRPGARLLVLEDNTHVGGVSGGCLEAEVIEVAHRVIAENRPQLLCYDTTHELDVVVGLGMGCNGVIRILVEPLQDACGVRDFLDHCITERRRGVMATVLVTEGDTGIAVGSRLVRRGDAAGFAACDPSTEEALSSLGPHLLHDPAVGTHQYEVPGGRVELAIEKFEPTPSLIIFGAGNDAQPLVRLAKELDWNVTVVDDRSQYASKERFPEADAVVVCNADDIGQRLSPGDRTMAVVMTHNFPRDVELLRALLTSPVRYIGLLGPRRRAERILSYLEREGVEVGDADWLHCPVGLDIGAETPEEIAVSILAEMQAAVRGRSGASLRTRAMAIHDEGD